MKVSTEIKPFYPMLEYILKRNEMFDIHEVNDLYKFYLGYKFSVITNSIEDEDFLHFTTFNNFVKEKFNVDTEHHWGNIISSHSKGDSLENFKKLLEEFRMGNGGSVSN